MPSQFVSPSAAASAAHRFMLNQSQLAQIDNMSATSAIPPHFSFGPKHPAAAAPRPETTNAWAVISGKVENEITHGAVTGALVTPISIGGDCQQQACPPVQTNSAGGFSVNVWPGSDEVLVQAPFYVSNYTIISNITAGESINIGIMFLVPNGYVIGTLLANDTAHTPLPGLHINGQSRDGKILATPYDISGPGGRFNVTVPPGDSEVEIAQTGDILGDTLFVHLNPGQTINVGTVYLTVGIVISVYPYDAVTNKPITSTMAGNAPAAISLEADNAKTGQGFSQGTAVAIGSMPTTVAPPGADLVHIRATGYITNVSYFNVQGTIGVTDNLGKVYLEPESPVSMTIGLTWGAKANVPAAKWGTGGVWARDCSLDGYEFSIPVMNQFGGINMTSNLCVISTQTTPGGCNGVGGITTVPGAPLRNVITDTPDTSPTCNPFAPTWPIPTMLPVTTNWTWANVTAGKAQNIGHLDLTPGTYIQMYVNPAGSGGSVSACSTDITGLCFPASLEGDVSAQPAGCASTSASFCVPAPPGPDQLKVQAVGCVNNLTEAYVPPGVWPGNEMPLPLQVASSIGISTVSLVCDAVQGYVRDQVTGGAPTGLVSVVVQPAGSATYGQDECAAQAGKGLYDCGAPPGWDVITASAPNYEVNKTWVFISAPFTVVPTINLTPESFLTGRVLGPNGYPLNTTSASVCPITAATASSCQPVLSAGLPNTNGTYWALVPSGHVPIGQYLTVADAPGFLSNQTWANVSYPGTSVTASTIILRPLLGSSAAPARAPHGRGLAPAAPPVGEYVVGRVIDNLTSAGIPAATITVTPVLGGVTSIISGSISADGYFNFSQPLGEYWFNITDAGYYVPVSIFQNLNGSATEWNMGVIRMDSFHYLAGRVVIDPWRVPVSIYGKLGAQATVKICNNKNTLCGASGLTDSGGFFNLSAPLGHFDRIQVSPTGTGPGSAPGGFLTNNTYSNVSYNNNETEPIIGLIIFATFAGFIRDSSLNNASPVRFATAALLAQSKTHGSMPVAEQANGGGEFIAYVEPANITHAQFQGSAFTENFSSFRFMNMTERQIENSSSAQVNWLPNASLDHFGWVSLDVLSSPSAYGAAFAEVPFAAISVNVTSNASIAYSTTGTADGFGYANVTAPFGKNVTIVVTAPDYNSTTIKRVTVNESRTTFINGTGPHNRGTSTIVPWAWVNGTVWDAAAPPEGRGVNMAQITIQNSQSVIGASSVTSNEIGRFMIDGPLGGPDGIAVVAAGYNTNNSNVATYPGVLTSIPQLNMTGEGIVAGRVFGFPSGAPLYGVTVHVCPVLLPTCTNSNTTTNGSGYFWVTASAGIDVMNLSLPGYSLNGSSPYLSVHSDRWMWAGDFVMSQFATVTGILLGNPSGAPLFQANASACSPLALPGNPTGPCFDAVQTDITGRFVISIPSGSYVLNLTAFNYNTTYLPIDLRPGEYVNLGSIFLEQFGSIVGSVFGKDTQAPVPNAQVQACPLWIAGNCTTPVQVGSDGRYILYGAPGEYLITASAPNYEVAYANALIIGGIATDALPIFLVPSSTNTLYSITGNVVAGPGLTPLRNAVISAGSDFATATDALGNYNLLVPWGTYWLTASANGYSTVGRIVGVHANLTGEDFVLPQAVYTVSGTTRDGLTGQVVPDVNFLEDGQTIASSDQNGYFAFALSNGTYHLIAQPPAGTSGILGPVGFTLGIFGAGVTRNVLLYPPTSEAIGLVVNVLTGLPLENVTISVTGTTVDNLPWSAEARTTVTGGFVLPLYAGHYTIVASRDGYTSSQTTVAPTGNGSLPVNLGLTPISVGASGGGGSGLGLTPALLLGAVAVVGIAAYLTLGRYRAEGADFGPVVAASTASGRSARGGNP